jgi:hypothetical protein
MAGLGQLKSEIHLRRFLLVVFKAFFALLFGGDNSTSAVSLMPGGLLSVRSGTQKPSRDDWAFIGVVLSFILKFQPLSASETPTRKNNSHQALRRNKNC